MLPLVQLLVLGMDLSDSLSAVDPTVLVIITIVGLGLFCCCGAVMCCHPEHFFAAQGSHLSKRTRKRRTEDSEAAKVDDV